jgi:Uma2 family endonuclease
MSCPFPGMDPYLERRALWPDFHDSFIAYLREALQPLLRPRYAALTQDRLFVVQHERPIRPDVSVIETRGNRPFVDSTTGAMVADQPVVVELLREEFRQPYLSIVEPAEGNRVVTAIEVLSPDNKHPGTGRTNYLAKQEELWLGHTNIVEIDLLRKGQTVVRIPAEQLLALPERRYLVSVTRNLPTRCELYGFSMMQRLPRISLPLASDDKDIPLDLQQVFTKCWNSGPYPELLHYEERPPGELTDEEILFCREIVAAK